jgi:hypothetical protein
VNDAIWGLIEEAFEAARRHLDMAVSLFDRMGMDGDAAEAYYAKMAFMHGMQSAHGSIERGLTLILELYRETLPIGEYSHANLIKAAAMATALRPAIVDAETAELLHETRRFRNFAAHSYEDFDASRSAPTVEAARKLTATIVGIVRDFRKRVEPDNDTKQ